LAAAFFAAGFLAAVLFALVVVVAIFIPSKIYQSQLGTRKHRNLKAVFCAIHALPDTNSHAKNMQFAW
jgi:hypothetical protein